MTDCQHWYDPEIVEREKREQKCEVYRLQARVADLENRLARIRDMTADIRQNPFRQDLTSIFQQQLETQKAQAYANSQMRALGQQI